MKCSDMIWAQVGARLKLALLGLIAISYQVCFARASIRYVLLPTTMSKVCIGMAFVHNAPGAQTALRL